MPLKLVKRDRTPFWILRGTVRGKRIEESTETADRDVAEEVRVKREAELQHRHVFGARAVASFAEAVVVYLEAGGQRRFLDPILEHFAKTPLAKIDQAAIDRGAKKLYPNAAPSTRNRQFYTPVSAVVKAAAASGLCDHRVIKRPKVDDEKIRWLSFEEANALIDKSAPHLKPLIIFMLYTGARAGEALWLDWRNLSLQRSHVSLTDTKNGETRGVPLHSRVVAALAQLPHREGRVFLKPDGKPYPRPKPDVDADTSAGRRIKTGFKAACRRAGLGWYEDDKKSGDPFFVTYVTPHVCRHTWATWHYATNRDLIALMKLGGWKSERMVLRYAHVNVAHLAPSIEALPGVDLGDEMPSSEIA